MPDRRLPQCDSAIRHGWKPCPFTSSLRSGDPSTSLRQAPSAAPSAPLGASANRGFVDLESVAHRGVVVLVRAVSVVSVRVRRLLGEEGKQHPTHFGAGVRGLPPLCAQNAHKDGAPLFLACAGGMEISPVGRNDGWVVLETSVVVEAEREALRLRSASPRSAQGDNFGEWVGFVAGGCPRFAPVL